MCEAITAVVEACPYAPPTSSTILTGRNGTFGDHQRFLHPFVMTAGLNSSTDPFLSCAQPHFGRDHGTAQTGLKWVVSAAGHKYLASVAGGNLKAIDQSDEPPLA